MKVIWISFLLIGHVICEPVRMGPRSGRADPRFKQLPWSRYSGLGGNSGSDGGSPQPSPLNPSYAKKVPGQDFYSTTTNIDELDGGNQGYVSGPEESQYGGSEAAAPGYNYGGAYDSAAPADNDDEPEIGDFLPVTDESPSEIEALTNEAFDAVAKAAENPAPFFSDVSDLEPVYSFSSRSKYLRGRAVISQSRYTPGEPDPPMREIFRRPSGQSRPADPQGKYIRG